MIYLRHQEISIETIGSLLAKTEDAEVKRALQFTYDWLSGKQEFSQPTSGSTGSPKIIKISRSQMVVSARETLEYLELEPGGSALLCLSADYIAGKMMIVRALENMMDLIIQAPDIDPMRQVEHVPDIALAAMVPVQVSTTMELHSHRAIEKVRNLLIGGSGISGDLEEALTHLRGNIYHSYGMTETVSHIALRKLNGGVSNDRFTTLPGVLIRTSKDGTLEIKSGVTNHQWITTRDIAEILSERSFRYIGRLDNVIVSAGHKIFPESIESRIAPLLKHIEVYNDFFVAGIRDSKYGELVTLVIEGQPELPDDVLLHKLRERIEGHAFPRKIVYIPSFKRTANGKVRRTETISQISLP